MNVQSNGNVIVDFFVILNKRMRRKEGECHELRDICCGKSYRMLLRIFSIGERIEAETSSSYVQTETSRLEELCTTEEDPT